MIWLNVLHVICLKLVISNYDEFNISIQLFEILEFSQEKSLIYNTENKLFYRIEFIQVENDFENMINKLCH